MAANPPSEPAAGQRPALGLAGLTVHAMALIAPGAFLWTTFQTQAALTKGTKTTASDMFFSLFAVLVIACLTALCYSELANLYHQAGAGSSYAFAEAAFLDKEKAQHRKWARMAKMSAGWISHLYYWVYPGVLVAYIATLVVYVVGIFSPSTTVNSGVQVLIAVASAALAVSVIQFAMLLIVSVLAIVFRATHGKVVYEHSSALDVITPHSPTNVVYQGTIAILLVAGFESVTALGAEAKNPKRHIRQAILLSLAIQGIFAYLFEYFAANYFIGNQIVGTGTDLNTELTGYASAAASRAPLGDFLTYMGDHWFSNLGIAFATIVAVTVVLALVGSILSAMNTGVRITSAMGRDKEMPGLFGFLHGKYATPHYGVLLMVVVSALLGAYGVLGINNLTQITLASNVGTFALYGLTCLVTLVAFWSLRDRHVVRHTIVPFAGAVLNIFMMLAVFYVAFSDRGDSSRDGLKALVMVAVWVLLGVVWFVWNSARQGRALLHAAG